MAKSDYSEIEILKESWGQILLPDSVELWYRPTVVYIQHTSQKNRELRTNMALVVRSPKEAKGEPNTGDRRKATPYPSWKDIQKPSCLYLVEGKHVFAIRASIQGVSKVHAFDKNGDPNINVDWSSENLVFPLWPEQTAAEGGNHEQ